MSIGELHVAPSPAARCARALGCAILGAVLAAGLTFLAWPLIARSGSGMEFVVPLIVGYLVLATLLTGGLLRWAKVRPAAGVAALGLALFLADRIVYAVVIMTVGMAPSRFPVLELLLDSIVGMLVHVGLAFMAAAVLTDRRTGWGAKVAAVLACLLAAVLAAVV